MKFSPSILLSFFFFLYFFLPFLVRLSRSFFVFFFFISRLLFLTGWLDGWFASLFRCFVHFRCYLLLLLVPSPKSKYGKLRMPACLSVCTRTYIALYSEKCVKARSSQSRAVVVPEIGLDDSFLADMHACMHACVVG